MENNYLRFWFKLSLYSLLFVAFYGMLMRYKIAFDFPFFNQRNLLHAHSHFAFGGWLSHLLFAGLALIIAPYLSDKARKKYTYIIAFNFLCSLGMLVAFTIQGYKAVSITFSTLSILAAVLFAYCFSRDAKHLPLNHPSKRWALAGLWLNVLSAAGPFSLAYMMASGHMQQNLYLASVYYYLHFQYNGWFFFGAMAIVVAHFRPIANVVNRYFWYFMLSSIPAFMLSILWAKLPFVLYIITVAAAIIQLLAWLALLIKVKPVIKTTLSESKSWYRLFFYAAVLSVSLKFILQAFSAIPSLSQMVFGFRPIVIAYLHLVLLGVYSLFFIGFLFAKSYIRISRITQTAAVCFFVGVVLNELLLAVQGFGAIAYIPIPYINVMLFGAAVVLWLSATILALSQGRR